MGGRFKEEAEAQRSAAFLSLGEYDACMSSRMKAPDNNINLPSPDLIPQTLRHLLQ